MKTKLFLLMAIVLFACSTAKAYDAEIDGIYYNFNGDEAEVTYKNTSFNSYSGDIVIPESFIYNKKTYSVTSIGEEAFADCYSLASANIPNSVTSIGGYAFYGCVGLTSVNIPNSVTSIGESVFADCTGLTTISISKSIYNINTGVFYGCSSLSSVIIPDGITSIGVNAFSGCSSLNSISIPKSIKTIGPAFHYCNNLSDVYCFAQSVPVSLFESNPFFNSSINSATLHVPYGCKAAYEAVSPWNEFGTIVEMEPENPIISFADAKVKALCVANWDTNSDGELDEAEAAAVTDLGIVFKENREITSFNELQYFTGLLSIEDYAFQSCYNLTSVNIPNSVTSIGSSAFAVCYGLTSVNIGNSVTSIGDYAFFNCPGLTSITIPNSVTSIGRGVFEECSGLTSVTIGNSVTSIGDGAFFSCSGLTSVTIPNSVTSIGSHAFIGCSSLTSVNIPNSVTSIGSHAFAGCRGLTSVTIPNSVTSIGYNAFLDCSGLTSVTIGNSVTSIGDNAFADCDGLTTINVEAGNTVYDSRNNCNAIIETATNTLIQGCKNTIIPNSVTSIGDNAFSYCSGLTSVTIGNSVTSIGDNAFAGCDGLTTVNIGNSVKSIKYHAFAGCKELTDVYCLAENVPQTGNDSFDDTPLNYATLHVPYGCKTAYEAASPWNEFGAIVEMEPESPIISFADAKVKALCVANWDTNSDGELDEAEAAAVTDLGTVFKGNHEITSFNELKYFAELTTIGIDAFYGCSHLASIAIPSSLTMVRKGAFKDCQSLSKVIVSDIAALCGIIYDGDDYNGDFPLGIAHHLYSDEDTEITELVIPEGVTKIEARTFRDAQYITSVTIPNSVTTIEAEAFRGMTRLTSLTIPNKVKTIGDNAFFDCSGLVSIFIGNGVESIGSEAFRNCNRDQNLTSITVADENIYYDSRNNCNAIIETVSDKLILGCSNTTIPEGIKSIGILSLQCCGFASINIPSSVTSIEADAMSHCPNLTSIDIPAGVSKIEEFTFYGCKSLTSVTMSKSVTSIGNFAFEGCTGLTDIYCYAEDVPNVAAYAFYNLSIDHTTLHVPYGCKAAYEAVSPWNEFGTIVEMEPENPIISFADAKVKALCVANWDTNSDGELDEAEAAAVTDLGTVFKGNTEITSFNELQYFTGLTAIGKDAFWGCSWLTSIVIPNSIKIIGSGAFGACNLTQFTIPNGVTTIGISAFYGCHKIPSIVIPSSVTSIEEQAFWFCSNMSVKVEEGNTVFDSRDDCNAIIETATNTLAFGFNKTVIPNSVTRIGNKAFYDCTRSNPISIPNSVTSIGDMAFAGCHNMTSIVIPNSVSNIGKGILGWCDKLTSVKVEEGNTIYDSRNDCNAIIETGTNTVVAGVKNTVIPNDIICIGDSAFCNCTKLTAIDIPNSVNSIGKYAFENCWSMSSISIGENVKTIGASAFEDCRALTSVDIPNSVTDIGEDAFSGCDSLKFVKIGNSVENIGKSAFSSCESLTSVDIPNSVTDIGEDAFSGCDSLKFVKIGNSVENIGESAFRYCESLTKVHVTDLGTWCNIDFEDQYANPLYYAGHLYMNDREITNLVIPSSVKNISNYAFFNCESLSSVVIPNSVTSIGYAAFDGCSNLASATIGSGVDSIDHYAFDNCPELTNVYCFAEKVPTTYTWAEAFNKTYIKNATLHVPYGCKAAYEAVSPWNKFGEIVEMTSPITIGETGFATFCSPYALDFSEVEDIRAYIVSGFNQETGTLVLTRVTEVPAGEGLYIAGMPGEHQIPQTQTSMFYANLLKGVTEPTIISPTDGNYTNYILSNGSYGVGFYTLSQTGTLDAGKAYLQLPTASVAGIKALKIEFDENDDPTGIAITSTSPTEENTIYNLAGQRVSKAQKGINIVNGKKVFIK